MQQPAELATYLPERNKLPARNDVPGTEEDPVRAVFAEQLQQAWAPDAALAPHNNEVLTALQSALQSTISGGAVPDAARSAQATIDEALATS
jgi:multiple sugar transport system substrate-binding protein